MAALPPKPCKIMNTTMHFERDRVSFVFRLDTTSEKKALQPSPRKQGDRLYTHPLARPPVTQPSPRKQGNRLYTCTTTRPPVTQPMREHSNENHNRPQPSPWASSQPSPRKQMRRGRFHTHPHPTLTQPSPQRGNKKKGSRTQHHGAER